MQDSAYTIFIIFGCIWVVMGLVAVIALFKSNNQKLQVGKWGLVVAIPIVLPFIIALGYQIFRPLIFQNFP